MIIGVPKEIKENEYRVAAVPSGVEILTRAGHTVLVEDGAGLGTGISNSDYELHGAKIVPVEDIWKAEMIIKVKEPQFQEYPFIREGQILFTYFHFASSEELTQAMIERKCICVAYETVETPDRKLPLLTPMSEVAGRMAVQEGAKYLERPMEGRGILLGGVPGVAPAEAVIIGAGVVGANAAKMLAGLGARVTVMDINMDRLRYLDDVLPRNVVTIMSNPFNIRDYIRRADLVISSVLVHGAKAPKVITRQMISEMKKGSVIIDVAIDQGGTTEVSHSTTHAHPTFLVDGVVLYCVANMPGAVAGTSTYALTNVTLPYIQIIADKGINLAAKDNMAILIGINIYKGYVTFPSVADVFGLKYIPAADLIY